MTRVIGLIVVLGVLVALTASWGAARPRADLVVAYTSIETLDPQNAQAHEDIELTYCLFEGLATFIPQTFEIVPGMAERWDVSEDRMTYTFHLRKDTGWSDGTPVTAWDFRYAWHLGMLPDTAPQYIEFLFLMKGGRDYYNWGVQSLAAIGLFGDGTLPGQPERAAQERMKLAEMRREEALRKFDELVGVRVIDDHTLEVKLQAPTPYFEEIASTWPLFPLHRPTLEAATTIDPLSYRLYRDKQWTKPGRIVSNGPMRLTGWKFKQSIDLEKNPNYWNRESVWPRTIELKNFQDHNTAFIAFITGELDVIPTATPITFAPELVAAANRGERDDVHQVEAFATYYYIVNCRPKLPDGRDNPFVDPRIRRALSMSVDRRQIVERVTRLYQKPIDVLVPPDVIPGYDSPEGVGYDPEGARRLLAEAGYPGGQGLPAIEVLYNTSGGHELVAQAMGRMWQETLGIDITFVVQEWKVLVDTRNRGQFMLARGGWFGDYSDPTTFLDLFEGDNVQNNSGMVDEVYDGLLAEAAAATDPARRLEILAKAEDHLLNVSGAAIPLYQYKVIHMARPEVEGVSHHARNMQHFYRMRKVETR